MDGYAKRSHKAFLWEYLVKRSDECMECYWKWYFSFLVSSSSLAWVLVRTWQILVLLTMDLWEFLYLPYSFTFHCVHGFFFWKITIGLHHKSDAISKYPPPRRFIGKIKTVNRNVNLILCVRYCILCFYMYYVYVVVLKPMFLRFLYCIMYFGILFV